MNKQDIEMPIKLAEIYDKLKSIKLKGKYFPSLNNYWKKRNLTAFLKLWEFLREKEYDPNLYLEAQFNELSELPYINSLYSEFAERRFLRYAKKRETRLGIIYAQKSEDYYEKIERIICLDFETLKRLLPEEQYGYDTYLVIFWINLEQFSPYFKYLHHTYINGFLDNILPKEEEKEFKLLLQELERNEKLGYFLAEIYKKNKFNFQQIAEYMYKEQLKLSKLKKWM